MKKVKYLGLFIAIIMVLQLAMPMNFVSGITGMDVSDRIDESKTKVEVRIYDGTELIDPDGDGKYNNVPKDAEVVMTYHFYFLNDDGGDDPIPYNYDEGDYINIDFPIDIKFPAFPDTGLELKMGDYVVGILTKDGKVNFTDYVKENQSNIEVSFQIKGTFKEEVTNQKNPVRIELWADGEILEIGFSQLEPDPVNLNLTKDGQINAANGEIEWTIKVTPQDGKIANGVILKDVFSDNQTFIDGSFTVNKVVTSAGITASAIGFELEFPGPIQGEQIITYKTKIKDNAYSSENDTYDKIIYKNNVEAFIDDVSKGKAEKELFLDWINKSGATADNYKKIKWTVTVTNHDGLLNGKDAVIEDILDSKLILVENDTDFAIKIKLDNNEDVVTNIDTGNGKYAIEGNKFTYYFNKNAEFKTATLTYYTEINNPSATSNTTVTYYNDAEIKWSTNSTGPSDKASIGIGKGIIQKSAGGTNAYYSNNEINWTVVINKNRVVITDAVFTDELPAGVTYKEGTFKLNNDAKTPTVSGSAVTYKLGTINTPQTITYTTTIDNNYKGLFTNDNIKFKNNASLSGGGITVQTDSAERTVQSQVISKSVELNYDYDTRIVQWKIVVNKNKIPLNGVVISDTIPAGMEFIPVSFKVDGVETKLLEDQHIVNGIEDINSQDSFIYTLGNITGEYVITFETKVKEAYLLESDNLNKTLKFKNNAAIEAEGFANKPKATATVDVNNYIVTKTGERAGYEFVKWSVPINKNEVTLSNIVLTDNLQEGLALDVSSVKLYEASVDNTGGLTKGSEIDLSQNSDKFSFSYDVANREFSFKISGETNKAYQLEFVTDVLTDKININNKIKFEGSGETAEYSADSVYVDVYSWSGSGSAVSGSLTLKKVDENGEPLTGAEFKVYDKLNKTYTAVSSEENTTVYKNLPYRLYYIEETKAPGGYLLDKTVRSVKLNSSEGIELKVPNKKALGTIALIKRAEENKPLEGAEFTLYKGEEAVGIPVTSDENGIVVFKDVEVGSYIVKETKAPTGYKIKSETISVEVKLSLDQTSVEVKCDDILNNEPFAVKNELVDVYGNIVINKVDGKGNPLEGSEFTLYDSSDSLFENPIKKAVSDENGKAAFENMDIGTYIIKETKATDGYYKASDVITAVITRSENLTETNIKYKVNDGEFTDFVPKIKNESIDVEISKQDEDNNPLAGAEFTLYNKNNEVVQVNISNDFGEIKFENLPTGKYIIKETKAPSRYYKSEDVIEVEVKENDSSNGAEVTISVNEVVQDGEVVIVNKRMQGGGSAAILGKIAIKKTDMDNNVLSGAEFTLYDEKGSAVQKGTTGDDGIVSFKEVLEGKYTIKETKAPEGYEITDEIIYVTVKNEQTITLNIKNKLKDTVVTSVKGNILINKVDENSKPLEGAEFTLYNNNKQVIETAVSNNEGIVHFESLPMGTYYVKETKAPDGYELVTDEKEIEIIESNTYSYKFKNVLNDIVVEDPDVPMGWENINDPDVPQEGTIPDTDISKEGTLPDTGNLLNTWILAAIGSLLILTGIVLLKRKNKIE